MFVIAVILFLIFTALALFLILVKEGYYKTIAVIFVFSFLAYEIFQYYWYSKVIPPQIKITYPISIGDESGFREGCGVAVFKISDETIEDIAKTGLKFFEKATYGRGYPKPKEPLSFSDHTKLSDYYYHTYKNWNETPVPKSWVSEGSWFICSVIRNDVEREIVRAAKLPGSFYTTKDEGQLFVIPSLGYVIFSYYG